MGTVMLVTASLNGLTTAIRPKDGYAVNVARSAPNTKAICDVRPATDEEIRELFEKYELNGIRHLMNQMLQTGSQLLVLVD